jgi:hypothetical protein
MMRSLTGFRHRQYYAHERTCVPQMVLSVSQVTGPYARQSRQITESLTASLAQDQGRRKRSTLLSRPNVP